MSGRQTITIPDMKNVIFMGFKLFGMTETESLILDRTEIRGRYPEVIGRIRKA